MSSSVPVADEMVIERGLSPHPCGPVLEKLREEAAVHFDAPDVRLTPVAFEERVFSYVLRVAVHGPGEDRPRSHVYIKVFKPRPSGRGQTMHDRIVHDFETTRRTREAMSGWDDVGAVRPVACYPEHLAIVTEETRGQTLGAFLQARARWFPGRQALQELGDIIATVGRWVRAFQTIDQRPGRISLSESRDYVDLRLERLVRERSAPFTEVDRSRVLSHIDTLARLVTPSDLADVMVHADLAPGNVVVDGHRVVVLDFAMTHRGSLMLDISRLYVQLDLMRAKPHFRRQVIRLLQRGLLRGFDPDLTDDHPLFRLLLLRHHVNHLLTLSVRRERFPATVYNAHLRRLHRRWIDSELSSGRRAREDR